MRVLLTASLISVILCAGAAQAEATQATPAGTPAPRDQNDGPAPGEEVDEVVVTAKRAPPPLPADIQIEQALFKLLETDPQRVVCTRRAPTGTRVPRVTCGSVERWFGARTPEDVADERAPWQLVEQIKFNRRMRAKNQRPG